jgi:D-inositol-3-phosphate glycosyltransferase
VDPSDSAGFAHALRALVDDPFRRQGMGFAGRSRARTRYTWDRIATDALAVYGRVGVEGDAPKLAGSTSTGHGNSR